jgi:hypothetical protein
LLKIVGALGATSRLSRGLDRGQQQRNQYPNNGYHHEQFNKRKTSCPEAFGLTMNFAAGAIGALDDLRHIRVTLN